MSNIVVGDKNVTPESREVVVMQTQNSETHETWTAIDQDHYFIIKIQKYLVCIYLV